MRKIGLKSPRNRDISITWSKIAKTTKSTTTGPGTVSKSRKLQYQQKSSIKIGKTAIISYPHRSLNENRGNRAALLGVTSHQNKHNFIPNRDYFNKNRDQNRENHRNRDININQSDQYRQRKIAQNSESRDISNNWTGTVPKSRNSQYYRHLDKICYQNCENRDKRISTPKCQPKSNNLSPNRDISNILTKVAIRIAIYDGRKSQPKPRKLKYQYLPDQNCKKRRYENRLEWDLH